MALRDFLLFKRFLMFPLVHIQQYLHWFQVRSLVAPFLKGPSAFALRVGGVEKQVWAQGRRAASSSGERPPTPASALRVRPPELAGLPEFPSGSRLQHLSDQLILSAPFN